LYTITKLLFNIKLKSNQCLVDNAKQKLILLVFAKNLTKILNNYTHARAHARTRKRTYISFIKFYTYFLSRQEGSFSKIIA